jgi:hypothetical protein
MFERMRRKSFGPRRPVLYPHQYGLALVTGLVLLGSIALVVWAVKG